MSREYFKGEREEQRAYSRAVKIPGGTTVYLAGVGAPVDADGTSLAGNFTAQTHRMWSRIRENLALAGGTLYDIVTMTVFITDARFGDEFHVPAGNGSPTATVCLSHAMKRSVG